MKQKHLRNIILITTLILGLIPALQSSVVKAELPSGSTEICPPPGQGNCPAGQCETTIGGKKACVLANPAPDYLVNFPDFGSFLKLVVDILLSFAGAIAVIFLVIGGYQYVVARGNEEAMEKAKKTITGSIIGIVVIVMAFAIVSIVNTLLTTTP